MNFQRCHSLFLLFLLVLTLSMTARAAEHGVTDKTILIGQSAPFTGASAQIGIQYNSGAQAYFDRVNAQGGVFGRKISLLKMDDEYVPELTQVNAKLLISQKDVFALFGFVGALTSRTAMPTFIEAGVPFFAPYSGADHLHEPFNRYVFNVRASHRKELEKVVQQLVTIYASNVAVFYQYDSDGWLGLENVEQTLRQYKLAPVAVASVPRNSTDVGAAVSAMLSKAPSAVVMISTYKTSAAFVRAMRSAGYRGQLVNLSFVGSQALLNELGKDGYGVMVSQVVPFPWSPSVAVVAEYQRAMEHAGTKEFDFTSLEGFIAAKVFVEGLRKSGKDLTREKFILAMETFNNLEVGDFSVSYSSGDHGGAKFVDLTMIGASGKFRK